MQVWYELKSQEVWKLWVTVYGFTGVDELILTVHLKYTWKKIWYLCLQISTIRLCVQSYLINWYLQESFIDLILFEYAVFII